MSKDGGQTLISQYFQFLQSSSKRQSLVKASQLCRGTEDVMLWSCGCSSCLWCRPASLELRDETDVCVPLSFPSVKCTASSEPGVEPADLRGFVVETLLGKEDH